MTKLLSSLTDWFKYSVKVFPHHTDYAGIVWHGNYIPWMEEARIEYLRCSGLSFEDLVAAGVDLPVVDLSIRYHQSAKMGEDLAVMTKFSKSDRLRFRFDYEIISSVSGLSLPQKNESRLCVTASVSLVPVDIEKRKILRRLPTSVDRVFSLLLKNDK
jgi:acyl-CoA thioester hydrolase